MKEGFRIQRFDLIFERRPYNGNYYRDKQSLGSIRLSPLGSSLTELVMEDSSSLDIDPEYLFCSAFNTEGWDRDSNREQATKIAKARFVVFRSMHQEVFCVHDGLAYFNWPVISMISMPTSSSSS